MKIGIEAQRLFREQKHGLEIVAMKMISTLQQIDKKNEYVIFVKQDKDNTCIKETDNFKIREISASSFPVWEQFKLPNAVKKEKLDLLHCTANTSPVFSPVTTLVTLHDVIFMESLTIRGNYYQNLGNIYRRIILSKTIRNCRKIITVSESEKNVIQKTFNISPELIDVVYNAVDNSFHKMDPLDAKPFRKKFGLPERFILFFGNSAKKKNTRNTVLGYLHYANQTNNPIPLVIAGAFESYVREELDHLHLSKHDREKIKLIGHIPFREQPAIYNLADLFLYTSTRESFGMPILEAMACGTPVITSNTSCMPEIAGNAAALVDPFDEKSIASGIGEVLSDHLYYDQLVQRGLEKVKQFSWENSASKTIEIYNTIIKK